MKKVLIIFGKKDWESPVFSQEETKTYQHCYEHLYRWAREEGVEMFRASTDWYDEKRKIFNNAWTFDGKDWQRVHDIKPDLIYDKTKFTPESQYFKQCIIKDFPIINDIDFTLLLDNKFFTSLLFPKFSKKHHLVRNLEELLELADKIKGDKIVIKKNSGSGGKDVLVLDKKDIRAEDLVFKDLSVQEFIDSSRGIEGIVSSTHDLRLVFINNDLVYSYLRIPKEGSFLANLSQGGTMQIVERKDLPKSLDEVIENVQNVFDSFDPKIYTIDLMFDEEQHPWIVELNSMPGLYFSPDQAVWMKEMYLKLIQVFKGN